jgi:16S rRNA (uracil1498-N3)-methyltransferase
MNMELRERASCAAQVFVYDLNNVNVDPDDRHHLARVLRLRAGEDLCAVDRTGAWQRFHVTDPLAFTLEPAGSRHEAPEVRNALTVAIALPKGERAELAVAKVTELGVDRIVILETERSVVRFGPDRAPKAIARFSRIARAASSQSRRLSIPEIVGPYALDELEPFGPVVVADIGAGEPSGSFGCIVVGPEGGFAPGEIEQFPAVGLSSTVLRTETAAIVAASWLTSAARGAGLSA